MQPRGSRGRPSWFPRPLPGHAHRSRTAPGCRIADIPRVNRARGRRPASVDSSVSRVSGTGRRACSVLRWAKVLRRLPRRRACAGVAAGYGANGKHRNDNDDDNQRSTGDPPANRRPLLLQLLIVRVSGGVALTVRRLAVSGLATLPVELAALAVGGLPSLAVGDVRTLAGLRRHAHANQSLCRGR